MEELTIEQKAKAYDEAIKKLRDFYRDYDTVSHLIDVKEELANLFPELCESKDEKIRKFLIKWIQDNYYHGTTGIPTKTLIAWLEKQGEQKSTDKPKFHEGDWVVQGDNILKIKCVGDTYYCFETVGGYVDDMLVSEIDSQFHLWTIKDAKPGDVLAAYECVVLFKEIDGLNIKCYCTYHYMGFNPSFYVDTLQNKTAFQPATKEQRDLLFQKMKESGYEWDAEKKELKKIENRPLLPDFFNAEYERGKADAFAQMQKEWSEEDGNTIKVLMNIIRKSEMIDSIIYTDSLKEKLYDWLKTLKQRYTWKPSDKQMNALENYIGTIPPYEPMFQIFKSLYNDLKKLKD